MDDTHARLNELVRRARQGDVAAFGEVVARTQAMACAAAQGVLRDRALAQDAAQDAYLRAFRRLADLDDPAGFLAWFRRVVVTVALNMRRARRATLLRLDDMDDVPVLDEAETSWTEAQRLRLATALLTLTPTERRLCDRRYHGRWSVGRLAQDAGVPEPVMRKRLQRLRDKLRKEIDVSEQRALPPEAIPADLPATIVELLARPQLTELPEHPVGEVLAAIRRVFADHTAVDLPEIVDLSHVHAGVTADAIYVEADELHHLDDRRILRYDLTLPLLSTVRYTGAPLRLFASGKAYRRGRLDATHAEAFHQAEVLCVDDRTRLDPWRVTGQVLESIEANLPGRSVRITPTAYAMCSRAWELEVDDDGHWFEVMAWGVFTDAIVRHLGADPAVHTAIGVGYGLDRLAMLRYGIDDIRKIESARVA